MEDILRQLVTYLRGMWLYRWWGLLAAWLVGAVAAGAIYVMPDRFESSARIYVDTQSVLKPLMSGLAVQPNVDQQITILSRTLISRPNIEKLIRMADLDLAITGKNDREELIVELGKKLQIRGTGRDNLFTLSYEDTAPERAKRVVQSLVSIFVESGLGDKRKDTDTARRFIEEQIGAIQAEQDQPQPEQGRQPQKQGGNPAGLATSSIDALVQFHYGSNSCAYPHAAQWQLPQTREIY